MVSLDLSFRRCPDVELTDLADALILKAPSGQALFGVNGVGRRIVQLLAIPQTVDSMVSCLVGEFRVEAPQCEKDVREFLMDLGERGLIENC